MNLAGIIFSIAATGAGVVFFLAGTIGLLRFPDTLSRMHALTKADTLGLGLIVLGVLPHVAWPFDAAKLLLAWVLVVAGGVSAAQMVARRVRKTP